jgi:hypothetical protein
MSKLNHSIYLCLFIVPILLCSCAVNRTAPTKKLDASIVPSDFNPQKHVLLVVEMHRKNKPSERHERATKKMESLLKKYYPYNFEIVSMQDIRSDNPKYADTAIYKYALLNKLRGVQRTTTATTSYISYCFLDRSNNKEYGNSYPSTWLKTSVQALANTVKKAKSTQGDLSAR